MDAKKPGDFSGLFRLRHLGLWGSGWGAFLTAFVATRMLELQGGGRRRDDREGKRQGAHAEHSPMRGTCQAVVACDTNDGV